MEKKYSVLGLMTCYNRCEKTKSAIKGLIEGNSDIEFKFMVLDDGSIDGTCEELLKFQEIMLYKGNGHSFYSGGMRQIIERAKEQTGFQYVLLFNDDVAFEKHSVEEMCEIQKDAILVGPTCDRKGKLSYGGVVKKSKWRPKTEIVMGRQCDTFNANCVLIPWYIFADLENIDRIYSHSMGDFDYGFQATRKGYRIIAMDKYVGICEDNCVDGTWRDKKLSRRRRIQLKETPKGLPCKEWFHYLKKNYTLLTAVIYSVIPYIRILLRK